MTENIPREGTPPYPAKDDHFGLEVDEQYIGRELSEKEVEEILNG